MHEVGIIEDLIKEVESQANAQNAYRVTKIILKIGKSEHLDHDSVNLWFKELSKNSIAEGAVVELKTTEEMQEGIYIESIEMEIDE